MNTGKERHTGKQNEPGVIAVSQRERKSKGLEWKNCSICGEKKIKSGHYLSCKMAAHREGIATVRSYIVAGKNSVEEWGVGECRECQKYVKQEDGKIAKMGVDTIRKVKLKDLRDRYMREKGGIPGHREKDCGGLHKEIKKALHQEKRRITDGRKWSIPWEVNRGKPGNGQPTNGMLPNNGCTVQQNGGEPGTRVEENRGNNTARRVGEGIDMEQRHGGKH